MTFPPSQAARQEGAAPLRALCVARHCFLSIAVSLTRHAEELHLLDVDGIAGFLYLPTLERAPALKILHAAVSRSKYSLGSRPSAPRAMERS